MIKLLFKAIAFTATACFHLTTWSQAMPIDSKVLRQQDIVQEQHLDFMSQIKGIYTAQLATVIIVPSDWFFRIRLTEAKLKEVGCTFSTSEQSNINSLINILKSAEVKVAPNTSDSWEQEPREGIYLTLANGSEVKFLFGKKFIDQDSVRGMFSHLPNIKNQHVTGNQTLPHELIKWAADTGTPIAKDSQTQLACQHFISNYALK